MLSEKLNKFTKNDRVCVVLLIIIILQSCGIRFFDGMGTTMALLITIFCIKEILRLKKKQAAIILSICTFITVIKILNSDNFETSSYFYLLLSILVPFLFLLRIESQQNLIKFFVIALKLIFIHSLIGYLLILIFPNICFNLRLGGLKYLSFAGIFFTSQETIKGFPRNTGMLWEPGILQMFLNLYLFYEISNKAKNIRLLLISLVIFSTFSTAGYLIFTVNAIYFFITNGKNIKYSLLFISLLLTAILSVAVLQSTVGQKFDGTNTSGLIRYRDYNISLKLISEKPFFGHGIFDVTYLLKKKYITNLESQLFSIEFTDQSGEMSGGFTNGLLGIFCWFGLPFGLIIYYYFYRNCFIDTSRVVRFIFCLILLLSFISEPITATSFFFLFPISYLLFKERQHLINGVPNANVL